MRCIARNIALFLFLASSPVGAVFVVTNTDDAGPGSLRQAILNANANPGYDTISFGVSGPGVHTISVQTSLPFLTDDSGVLIDGYSQPGATTNSLSVGNNGLLKIELEGSSLTSSTGAALILFSSGNTVQGLVINRFPTSGFYLEGSNNVIQGNFIGVDPTGTIARPNGGGIEVHGANHRIGGSDPAARNVVSGNRAGGGILIVGNQNLVRGNYIGTNSSGTAALGNEVHGLFIDGAFNTIGGLSVAERNVVSGNNPQDQSLGGGITLSGPNCTDNVLQGNVVGASADGVSPVPNRGYGMWLESATQRNTIGGTVSGAGNRIVFNTGAGILVGSSSSEAELRNSILSNSIAANGGLGIDIRSDGVTLNDPGDGDVGPNGFQNFPTLLSPRSTAGTTIVEGRLESSPSATFTVQLFSNASCDPTGYGEGDVFLGSTTTTTDATGQAAFSVSLPAVPAGRRLTATATDALGNTSEFSPCSPLATSFYTVTPCRVVDTRGEPGPSGGPALLAFSERNFPVAGICGISATARSVAFNFTVTEPSDPGHLTIYPAGTPVPLASTINYRIGKTRANNAIVSLGSTGEVSVFCGQPTGRTHLIIDVVGYFE